MKDFKIPTNLGVFVGDEDEKADPQAFLYALQEKLRILEAPDEIMCRILATCLSGLSFEWFTSLPRGSITSFEDFANKFLAKFANVKPPVAACESLFGVVQEPNETTRRYVNRFVAIARTVKDFNDQIAVTALRLGLKPGGPGSLRFDSHKRTFSSLQEFVHFAEGYIRGEEDAAVSRDA
jgi:hypothetical protein